jgi:transmembrane sensor
MTDEPIERRAWRTDDEWKRLSERIAAEPLSRRQPARAIPWRWVTAAALAAGMAATAAVPLMRRSSGAVDERTMRTAAGERLVVRLSDSTVVTLGPATVLHVRTNATRRNVALEGEAQFNVVHDSRRPFVVSAGAARATDVGTRFVVRAYSGDTAVQIAVIDGIVSLSSAARTATAAIMLRAGEVGVVARDSSVRRAPAQIAASYAAWVDGRLSFDDTPLSAVGAELGRWFDVDIRITDSTLARRHVTATYNDARLADVLAALTTTLHAGYARTGRSIVIAPAAVRSGGRP